MQTTDEERRYDEECEYPMAKPNRLDGDMWWVDRYQDEDLVGDEDAYKGGYDYGNDDHEDDEDYEEDQIFSGEDGEERREEYIRERNQDYEEGYDLNEEEVYDPGGKDDYA